MVSGFQGLRGLWSNLKGFHGFMVKGFHGFMVKGFHGLRGLLSNLKQLFKATNGSRKPET